MPARAPSFAAILFLIPTALFAEEVEEQRVTHAIGPLLRLGGCKVHPGAEAGLF